MIKAIHGRRGRTCRDTACRRPAAEGCARRGPIIALVMFAGALFVSPATWAQQTPRAKELGKRVKCMCGGCNDAAGLCYHSGGTFSGPCATALDMLKKIDERVAKGESDDAILKSFVQEYGPTVLIEPPKSGFNLTAWIMPIVAPLIALFALWEVVRRWRHRAALTPATAPGTSGVPPELLERVQREVDGDSKKDGA